MLIYKIINIVIFGSIFYSPFLFNFKLPLQLVSQSKFQARAAPRRSLCLSSVEATTVAAVARRTAGGGALSSGGPTRHMLMDPWRHASPLAGPVPCDWPGGGATEGEGPLRAHRAIAYQSLTGDIHSGDRAVTTSTRYRSLFDFPR